MLGVPQNNKVYLGHSTGDAWIQGGTGDVYLKGKVGIGTEAPEDMLDVAGSLRILSGSNPIRFTGGWTDFPNGAVNRAEISNDTDVFKSLMIVGNRSADGATRKVSVWDRLEVSGSLWTGTAEMGGFKLIASPSAGYVLTSDANGVGTWQPAGAASSLWSTSGNDISYTNGNVGIGTIAPEKKLHVEEGEVKVRASHDNIDADIGAFYAHNLTQGIGIGYNRIQAVGTNPSQDIVLQPKGGGKIDVTEGDLEIDVGRLMGHATYETFSYDGKDMGWYTLGWMPDSWNPNGHTAWIAGYGGIKFFAEYGRVAHMTSNGHFYALGNVTCGGTKEFRIPHPTEAGKDLVHAAVEGPEAAVFYRGEAQLTNGTAEITLPDYFEALTRTEDRTAQLTCKNGWSPLYVDGEIADDKLIVKTTDAGDPSQTFYWEVKAVRADVAPLEVEVPAMGQ